MGSLNIGILGHVDCGKTTLTKRIAELGSTSSFDKHADQSGARRNTLDLGFSSLFIEDRRLSLVDCPGHAALIKAVLAASTVFDMAIVVVDATNGIQPQTAEHLLMCSFFCPDRVIVVVNKIDLIEKEKLPNVKQKLRKGLKAIGISEKCQFVDMSLSEDHFKDEYIDELRLAIKNIIYTPTRAVDKPLQIAIDHCFPIKGKGTILTGTVLTGTVKVGDDIEFAPLNETKRIKGLESWKEPMIEVCAGERVALNLQNFNSEKFSRQIVSIPGLFSPMKRCIASIEPISFFRSTLNSKTKMHISIGFETIMAECQFLRQFDDEYEQLSIMEPPCAVLLNFERNVFLPDNDETYLIASRLDQLSKGCRFAFRGCVQKVLKKDEDVKRFSRKHRTGYIERIEADGQSAICGGMFKPETNIELFANMTVTCGGVKGRIEGKFGKSGKFRVIFDGKVEIKQNVELHMKKYLNDNSLCSYIPTS